MAGRHFGVLAAALLASAAPLYAQETLPPGLERQGGVIMMRPIGEGDIAGPLNSEHRLGTAHVLSPVDHDVYMRAFEAADRGDWTAARNLADQGHDPVARRVVQWRYLLDKNSGASFQDIDAFVRTNADWPLRDVLFARAEAALAQTTSPAAIVAWFGTRAPSSPIGEIRLGEALIGVGKSDEGRTRIRRGWAQGQFDPPVELAIVQKDGQYLTSETDRDRLDNLLWHDDTTAARRQLARVDDATARIGEVRLALRSNRGQARQHLDNLPGPLASDPALLFDRARGARRDGNNAEAESLLLRAGAGQMARAHTARWWPEVNVDARQALQDRDYRTAYALVAESGLTSGDEFQEAEFLAGWIALRYLKEPRIGLAHFEKLEAGVSRPISKARARYWEGRCYETLGDLASAWQRYHLAAQYPEAFYGQLALARIEQSPVLHLASAEVASTPRADFDREDLSRAMAVLADLGAQNLLRVFALRDEEIYSEPGHAKTLMEALTGWGFSDVALRVAKLKSYDGVLLLPYTHPTISIPPYKGPDPTPETSLVLGIIRQETEFDPAAQSGPGARGLMQVMPGSAKRTAAAAGLSYRPNDLTADPEYNMQLGMAELSSYLREWSGSYVLAAASYNAGANNADRWATVFGDPRNPANDPVDWIENITFSETRNYVERVIENTEIYRSRLAGRDVPLRILADLYRPGTPVVGAIAYSPAAGPAADAPVPVPLPKPGSAAGHENAGDATTAPVPKARPSGQP